MGMKEFVGNKMRDWRMENDIRAFAASERLSYDDARKRFVPSEGYISGSSFEKNAIIDTIEVSPGHYEPKKPAIERIKNWTMKEKTGLGLIAVGGIVGFAGKYALDTYTGNGHGVAGGIAQSMLLTAHTTGIYSENYLRKRGWNRCARGVQFVSENALATGVSRFVRGVQVGALLETGVGMVGDGLHGYEDTITSASQDKDNISSISSISSEYTPPARDGTVNNYHNELHFSATHNGIDPKNFTIHDSEIGEMYDSCTDIAGDDPFGVDGLGRWNEWNAQHPTDDSALPVCADIFDQYEPSHPEKLDQALSQGFITVENGQDKPEVPGMQNGSQEDLHGITREGVKSFLQRLFIPIPNKEVESHDTSVHVTPPPIETGHTISDPYHILDENGDPVWDMKYLYDPELYEITAILDSSEEYVSGVPGDLHYGNFHVSVLPAQRDIALLLDHFPELTTAYPERLNFDEDSAEKFLQVLWSVRLNKKLTPDSYLYDEFHLIFNQTGSMRDVVCDVLSGTASAEDLSRVQKVLITLMRTGVLR